MHANNWRIKKTLFSFQVGGRDSAVEGGSMMKYRLCSRQMICRLVKFGLESSESNEDL
jgi:hypothetical protein